MSCVVPTIEILFTDKQLKTRLVHSCNVTSSWTDLKDVAEFILPLKMNDELQDKIKVGDAITIKLGYDNQNNTVFEGFISEIIESTPLQIRCEDAFYQFREKKVHLSYAKISLSDLLKEILPKFEIDAMPINLSNYRAANSTVAKVLMQLKTDYNIYTYVRGKRLVSGKIYTNKGKAIGLAYGKNIVSRDLSFKSKNRKVKINASCIYQGKKVEVSVGQEGGDEYSLPYKSTDKASLKIEAEKDLKKQKEERYTGTITTFGATEILKIPFIQHSDFCQYTDKKGKKGNYFIDKVEYSLKLGELRQIAHLGKKI